MEIIQRLKPKGNDVHCFKYSDWICYSAEDLKERGIQYNVTSNERSEEKSPVSPAAAILCSVLYSASVGGFLTCVRNDGDCGVRWLDVVL